MAKPPLALLALALLLAAPATAGPLLEGEASAVSFTEGARGTAAMRGLIVTGTSCEAMVMEATVAAGRMEVDESRADAVVGGVSATPANQTTVEHALGGSSIRIQPQERCAIQLVAISAHAPTITHMATIDRIERQQFVHAPHASNGRADLVLDASRSLEAAGDLQLVLTGHFRIAAWEATILVQNDTGDHAFETGNHEEPIAPGDAVRRGIQREAFIDLYDARMTIDGASAVFLDEIRFSSPTGVAILKDPQLPDAQAAGATEIQVTSPFSGRISGETDRLAFAFDEAGSVTVDGQVLTLEGGDSPWLWPSILLAVAVLVVVGIDLRRRAKQADALVGRGDYAKAARVAATVSWVPVLGRSARIARVVSLFRLGRLEEAEALLTPARPWHSMEPTWHYLWAHLSAAKGDVEAATDSLAECLAMSPGMLPEARTNPVLEPVFDEALKRIGEAGAPAEGYS